jgi:hypothetical protein
MLYALSQITKLKRSAKLDRTIGLAVLALLAALSVLAYCSSPG